MTLGTIPHFWEITRPGRYWVASDMNKIVKLCLEDGFQVINFDVWPFGKGTSTIIVSHINEGAVTLLLLRHIEIVKEWDLKISSYYHNTKERQKV